MPQAWQFVLAAAAGLGLATWFAYVRLRVSRQAWVDAWHYSPSRRDETRAAYLRWRLAFWAIAFATAISWGAGAWVLAGRVPPAPVTPRAAATAWEARPSFPVPPAA